MIRTTAPLKQKSDIEKLLIIEGRDGLYIHFGLFTALRISEILSLRWGQVISPDGEVLREITIQRLKKKKENKCQIGISDDLYLKIKNYYKGQPLDHYIFSGRVRGSHLTKEAVNYMIKQRLDELKINTRHPTSHTLRKTFGRNYYEQEVLAGNIFALTETMLMLGKTSERNTLVYIGVEQDDLIENFKRFKYI